MKGGFLFSARHLSETFLIPEIIQGDITIILCSFMTFFYKFYVSCTEHVMHCYSKTN